MTSIGMNLAPVNYWSTEYPFIDRMKSSGAWAAQGTGNLSPIPLDANGYPTGFPAGADRIYTMVAMDPVSMPMTDTYVLTYEGTASFRPVSSTIISSEPGKIVFKYNGDSTMMPLIVESMSASDPLTAIHIVREDQVDLFNKGEIFNPALLDKVQNWDTLRFMDWGNTNASTLTSWSQRITPDSVSWGANTSTASVPIEVMVALANQSKTNMWINIPTQADDDYVRKTLEYVRDNLSPDLKVDVEYSNEVWNFGFQQSKYAQSMANQLWGNDANGNGQIDGAEVVGRGNFIYYGYRSAQVAAIAKSVFGDSAADRLDTVISTQTVYHGIENQVFQGVAKAGLGDVADLFSDYSITSYFGDDLWGTTESDRATILQWARSGAAGLDAAFQEMLTGNALQGRGSIADLIDDYEYQKGVAAQNGLDLVSYEGGLGLMATNFPADQQAEIMDFFSRLMDDPRMGDLATTIVDKFGEAGGSLLNFFNDVQPAKPGGTFGIVDTVYDTSTTQEALTAKAAAAPAAASQTDLSNYVMANGQSDLAFTGSGNFSAQGNGLANKIVGGNRQNRLDGGAGNDVLIGGTGNDSLNGGAGVDTMIGGLGNDIYVVDNVRDYLEEAPGAGIDEVQTTLVSYMLAANFENLTFTGGATGFSGTGNALNNVLRGNAGADTLMGGGGNDTLMGGAGNDTYIIDDAGDVVIEASTGGTDTVRTALDAHQLGANVEALIYTGQGNFYGRGNELSNTITGGAGDDTIDGGLGADRMIGGLGNDVYYVDSQSDTVIEAVNGGIDTVFTTASSYTLAANVENLGFAGQGAFTGWGNALDNVITGGSGANSLNGFAGNDTLIGGAADDKLDGGAGKDILIGGKGNDTYVVDDAGDQVIEMAGEGSDTVNSNSTAYTLGANVENLWIITNNAGVVGTGNELANWILGGYGGNRLSGMGGDDSIYARTGNDTLDGGDGNDVIDASDGDDLLFGGNGNDRLVGGMGNDTLYGGAGIDVLIGGTGANGGGADRFVFRPGDLGSTLTTTDSITDFSGASGDRIDLSAFNAVLRNDGRQKFIGTDGFTRKAGQVRAQNAGGSIWEVMGDLNGDGVADYSLKVDTKLALTNTDFIL